MASGPLLLHHDGPQERKHRVTVGGFGAITLLADRAFPCAELLGWLDNRGFPLEDSGLRDPQRIDRLLLLVAIAGLAGSLQGYALSLAGLRRQVDPHWKRGMNFLRVGQGALQMLASDATSRLMVWLPLPLRELEPCIPSRRAQQTQAQAWFSRIELPPRSRSSHRHKPLLAAA